MTAAAVSLERVQIDNALMWENTSIVRRYCADESVGLDDGHTCFAALKQFLIVCGVSSEARAPSARIDDMWHTALLFTRAYRDYCIAHFGRIIDHEPLDEPVDWDVYARTRSCAEALFGPLDERYWAAAPDGDCGTKPCDGERQLVTADCRGSCSRCGGKSVYQP